MMRWYGRSEWQKDASTSPQLVLSTARVSNPVAMVALAASMGGKKVNGRKRHVLVDVLGFVLAVVITPANVQDRDGAIPVLMAAHAAYPTIKRVWADCAYNGEGIARVQEDTGIVVEVVKHEEGHRGFAVLPRRWVVERTNAWFGRFRILNKEYERTLPSSRADVLMGMTMIMLRRLTASFEQRAERR
jgi:transposase